MRDGSPPQLNIVRSNGTRSILTTILKNGEASTLSVVNTVKSFLPQIRAAAPKGIEITPLSDQSVFVTGAINDVVREALIAATLTGLMILLFLGSWRSTIVVLVSIPLAILFSLIVLWLLGETLNIMTLGGLALAVGILVDDATVAIENTYRLMEDGRPFREAVVNGASGIAKPALISTLAICSAFVSVFFLTDAPKFLFTPQAMAVVFAMLASYVLSRTLVPVLVDVLVKSEYERKYGTTEDADVPGALAAGPGLPRTRLQTLKPLSARIWAGTKRVVSRPLSAGLEALLAKTVPRRFRVGSAGDMTDSSAGSPGFATATSASCHAAIGHRMAILACVCALAVLVLGGVLFEFVGQDYFPQVSGDQLDPSYQDASRAADRGCRADIRQECRRSSEA